jgi:hypothetical protein
MNEPRRLLDEEGTPFERSLLSALANERPSPELERRMRQGLTVVGTAAGVQIAVAGWIKVAAAGLVAAGLGAGFAVSQRAKPDVAPTVAAPPPPPLVAKPAPSPEVAPVEPSPPKAIATAAPVRPPVPASGDMREEIRLLDQARAAVRGGENEQALRLLEKYDRRYPRGQFRQEVQVLRVEALERSGNKKAALALGKKFVAEHPESPHVERVQSVTGSER